ncbi:IF-2 protein [Aggregicoccus sp. 17bor-14]|uniref:IF-2 protein n=1 Tax=Myxococcaceae TaxID=31 RepID=UPI00129D00F6|nr:MULTISPECIES: IF-2 protein [Myxococcaceae]MBF5042623.1 IF-2 protein [Simulacricoccus sp. 17bor-14]MRI88391.1 IF-2 protein [Aggregicoccus sp. 17bor-14]
MDAYQSQSFGHRAGRTFTRFLVTLVVLALAGGVLFLLSQLNSRTYRLAHENGQLVVLKGRMLPFGAVPYTPGDARLADAYAPLAVPAGEVQGLLERRFSDRDELDRALFGVLEALARPRVASDEPARLDEGLTYLRRAEKLSGLTEEQRLSLKKMQADVAYYQARQRLDEARRDIAEALGQLKLAAENRGRQADSANAMITRVGPAAEKLEEALRAAVHGSAEAPAPGSNPGSGESPAQAPGAAPPPSAAQGATAPTSGSGGSPAVAPAPAQGPSAAGPGAVGDGGSRAP